MSRQEEYVDLWNKYFILFYELMSDELTFLCPLICWFKIVYILFILFFIWFVSEKVSFLSNKLRKNQFVLWVNLNDLT